jgi:hypothetical protein
MDIPTLQKVNDLLEERYADIVKQIDSFPEDAHIQTELEHRKQEVMLLLLRLFSVK